MCVVTGYPPPEPGPGSAPDAFGPQPGQSAYPPPDPPLPYVPTGYGLPVYQSPPAYPGYQPPPAYSGQPGPPGYPAPYPPAPPGPPWASTPTRPRLDGLSVASFILGLISVLFLSIPFSIAGLVRTSAGRRRGRGFAVAGLVLSVVWVVVIVATLAYSAGRKPDRSADGTVTHQGSTSPLDLRVGDCVKLPPITAGESQVHSLITVVPCSTPHNAQVFTIVTSRDLTYPGSSTLLQEGLDDCSARAPAFIGKSTSALEVVDFVPTQVAWDGGDRSERCLLVDGAQDITGDIRPHA